MHVLVASRAPIVLRALLRTRLSARREWPKRRSAGFNPHRYTQVGHEKIFEVFAGRQRRALLFLGLCKATGN
jgi:hypothetical protein